MVTLTTLLDTFSGCASSTVLTVVATVVEKIAMTGLLFPCSKGRSFLLEDSRHVTVAVACSGFETSSRLNHPSGVL